MSGHDPTRRRADPAGWNKAVTTFMDVGFTYADAALIADQWAFFPPNHDHTAEASYYAEWLDTGFTAREALAWILHATIHPDEAATWATNDWQPRHVGALQQAITDATAKDDDWSVRESTRDQVTAWTATDIPPDWCARYAAAGHTPDTIDRLETDRNAGLDHAAGLATLAALLRASG